MAPRWSNNAPAHASTHFTACPNDNSDVSAPPPDLIPSPQPSRSTLFSSNRSPLYAQPPGNSEPSYLGCTSRTARRHISSLRLFEAHHRYPRSSAQHIATTKSTPAPPCTTRISASPSIPSHTQLGEIVQSCPDTSKFNSRKYTISDSRTSFGQNYSLNNGRIPPSQRIGKVFLGPADKYDVHSVSHLARNHSTAAIVGAVLGALFISVILVLVYLKALSFPAEIRNPHLEQPTDQAEVVHPLRVDLTTVSPTVPDTAHHPDSSLSRARHPLYNRHHSELGQSILPAPHPLQWQLHNRWSWASQHSKHTNNSSAASITFPESISTRSSLRFLHLDRSSLERHSVASGISSTCSVLVFAQPAAFDFVGPTGFYGHSEAVNTWNSSGKSRLGWIQPLSFMRERPSIY